MRSKPSQRLFFVPAARPAYESESTPVGSTTIEVAVLPADETYMRNIKEVRWIESTLWRVGERGHTNLDLKSHQRPKARQAGLSLGLVFVTVVLGRWLLVFAGVAFAVVTFGGGGRVLGFSVLVQVLQRSGAGPSIITARAARVPGLQPTL
jgi:hypothetical protein